MIKLDGVALLVADPSQWNSTTRKNPPIQNYHFPSYYLLNKSINCRLLLDCDILQFVPFNLLQFVPFNLLQIRSLGDTQKMKEEDSKTDAMDNVVDKATPGFDGSAKKSHKQLKPTVHTLRTLKQIFVVILTFFILVALFIVFAFKLFFSADECNP